MGPDIPPDSDRRSGLLSGDSGRKLYWRLVLLYTYGTLAAVVVTFTLVALGLELTWHQWTLFFIQVPFAVAIYTIPDIWLIGRQYRPLREGLEALDRGETDDVETLSNALVRALNLPFLSAMRVPFFHGPLASLVVLLCTLGTEPIFNGGYTEWQAYSFAATALFFASPTHAIFEYFAVNRELLQHIHRLNAVQIGRAHV